MKLKLWLREKLTVRGLSQWQRVTNTFVALIENV